MSFEQWLDECRMILRGLNIDPVAIEGAGIAQYRRKFDAGMAPQECVDDELSVWNE